MKWIELSIEVHPEAVDAVAEVFREHGTDGVAIEQPIRVDEEGEREPVFVGMPIVKAYLPVTADVEDRERAIEGALWHLQAFDLSPVGSLKRREVDEEDWAHGWKEHFHPLKIGRIVVKPTWRDWDAHADEIVVELDPGMAFGTGLHPTTRLTLLALQDHAQPGMQVLDLGTGSGILAIAAARLGARVTALDISEVAVEVCKQNVAANRVEDRVQVLHGSIQSVEGEQYDLILGNIIARVLIDLAPQLAAALRPGAVLLASGIIGDRVDEVRQGVAEAGLRLAGEESDGDWWLIIAERPA